MIKSGCCKHPGGGFSVIVNISIAILQKLTSQIMKEQRSEMVLEIFRSESLKNAFKAHEIEEIVKEVKRKCEEYAKYG
jgi:hypothetical protein